MGRKIGSVSLVALAVAAMSLSSVSSASAISFHSEAEHTILKAGQTTRHEFTAGSGFGAISCEEVSFEGTMTSTSQSEVELTPSYSGCKDSLGRTVHPYELCPEFLDIVLASPPVFQGVFAIACAAGFVWAWHVTNGSGEVKCTVEISPQENVGPVEYENVENGDIKVIWEVNNLVTTTSGGLLNCGISNGTHTNGTYTGSSIISGTNTEGWAVNLSVE